MGQKTHPVGFRLGIVQDWKSRWYAERDFPRLLHEDETIRKYLRRRLSHAALAMVEIERKPSKIVVTLHTARPGVVIGKRGAEVDKLRDELALLTKSEISVNVEEIKRPELSAYLVAENVAHQLRQRISFRRAMKRAIQSARRAGAEGIKIQCSGRLGGAEIARREGYNEGRVPLHTLRADIDYAEVPAFTTYGVVGVKCWIFKGEIVEERRGKPFTTPRHLAGMIEKIVPRHGKKAHQATKVFKALRIAVNDEIGCLQRGLEGALQILKPGGRLAVITFHSLEDRTVKLWARHLARDYEVPGDVDVPALRQPVAPRLRLVSRKAIQPSDQEVRDNPHSRSAQLRVVEKI